jgi:hypothetical protein
MQEDLVLILVVALVLVIEVELFLALLRVARAVRVVDRAPC